MLRHIPKFVTEKAAILVKTMVLPYLDLRSCFLTAVKVKEAK